MSSQEPAMCKIKGGSYQAYTCVHVHAHHVDQWRHMYVLVLMIQWNSSIPTRNYWPDNRGGHVTWVNLCTCIYTCNWDKQQTEVATIQRLGIARFHCSCYWYL